MKGLLISALTLLLCSRLSAQDYTKIRECILENGILKEISVDYNRTNGEKTVLINGVRTSFEDSQDKNKEYAFSTEWYKKNDSLKLLKGVYVKYGLPRVLGTTEVKKAAVYKGVPVFAEPDRLVNPEVIYVPVRHGCEFQPYQLVPPDCGSITINKNLKKPVAGGYITLTAKMAKVPSDATYYWNIGGGTIKAGSNGRTIQVLVADKSKTLQVSVSVKGTNCYSTSKVVAYKL